MAFKLDANIAKTLASLASDLEDHVAELRDKFDARSEQWRDSEKGGTVDAWLEQIEELITTLENFPEEPEDS